MCSPLKTETSCMTKQNCNLVYLLKEKVGGGNGRDIFTPVLNIQQLACRVIRPTNRALHKQKEQVVSSSCYQQTLRLKLEQMFLVSVESSRTGWVTLLPM